MEKKRKRDKSASAAQNGTIPPQDTNKEAEHKEVSDFSWTAAAQHQVVSPPSVPTPTSQDPQGTKAHPLPYWPYSEFPPRPYFPMPPASTERQQANQNSSQGANAQYSFPGPWQHPPFVPPAYVPFFYPPPTLQKGLIKPPQGMSQKHQKLWEMQSAENMQLWSILARVEAELGAQRSKIAQLEADLQSLKGPQEAPKEAATVTPKEPSRRGRYKRTVIGNIPPEAIAPRPRGRKPASEKLGIAKKVSAATTPASKPLPLINGAAPEAKPCETSGKANGGGVASGAMAFGTAAVATSNYGEINWGAQTNGTEDEDEGEDEDCVVAAAKLVTLDPVVVNQRW